MIEAVLSKEIDSDTVNRVSIEKRHSSISYFESELRGPVY